jgi:hypothetical protein
MRCDEFEARLNDLLDLRLDPTDDLPLADHADDCAICERLLSAYRDSLSALPPQELPAPADLSCRVLEHWQSESIELSDRSRGWYLPHFVTAAAAILIAFYLFRPDERPAPRPIIRSNDAQLHTSSPRPAAPSPIRSLAESANADGLEPWSDLADGAVGVIAEVASLWPQTPAWQISGNASFTPAAEKPPMIAEVASGLKPLAESATGTMHWLLDVLPASGDATRNAAADGPPGARQASTSDEAS